MGSKANPIGIEKQGGKIQSLSCVGIDQKTALQTAPAYRSGRPSVMPEPAHADRAQAGADDRPVREPIQSLGDLWQRVGIRAMALLPIGRAGALLADQATARRCDRLSVARAAQLDAIARQTRKQPAPVLAERDNGRHVDRSEAQDLYAWSE